MSNADTCDQNTVQNVLCSLAPDERRKNVDG